MTIESSFIAWFKSGGTEMWLNTNIDQIINKLMVMVYSLITIRIDSGHQDLSSVFSKEVSG